MTTRRAFISGITVGFLAAPLAAQAQQPAMPVVGWLASTSPALGLTIRPSLLRRADEVIE